VTTIRTRSLAAIGAAAALVGAVAMSAGAASLPTSPAPGTGFVRLVCQPGRAVQTIVIKVNTTGINTSGATVGIDDLDYYQVDGTGVLTKRLQGKIGTHVVSVSSLTSIGTIYGYPLRGNKQFVTVTVKKC